MENYEQDLKILFETIDGFTELRKQVSTMEKNLYREYLNKKDFDVRMCIGKLNIGILVDLLLEDYLSDDNEELLLTLVIRFAEDMINGVADGQDIWESASAYDFTKTITTIQEKVAAISSDDDLHQYISDHLPRHIYLVLPLIDDASIELYKFYLRDNATSLQELLLAIFIFDNLDIEISESTAKILLELVNDEEFYMVSDFPLIETVKHCAILTLKGKEETTAD